MYIKHLRYQIRNLFTHFSFYWIQVSLALFAIFFVQIIQKNIDARIEQKGQALLGADISISLRGKWEGQEKEFLPFVESISSSTTEVIEVSAMVTTKDRSLLANLIAVEEDYPLYGDLMISPDLDWKSAVREHQVLVYQEVLDQLGIHVGDVIKVGEQEVKIAAVVTEDAVSGSFTGLLPKIYIAKNYLQGSTIIGPMSSETRRLLVRLKPETDLKATLASLQSQIKDPSIRINSRNAVNEQSSRILDYLTDYMGLISIVTIVLTFFGSLYLFRHFFFKQLQNIAIYKSLGFSPSYINRLWIGQMLILSVLITLTTFVATYLLFPLLAPWLLKNISKDMVMVFHGEEIYVVFLFSLFLSLSTHFLYSKNIKTLRPAFLLKQGKSTQDLSISYVVLVVLALLFVGFSFLFSKSWVVTGIFVASIFGFFILSWLLLQSGFYLIYQARHVIPLIKYISLNFYRNSATYLFLMISLSFGFTILSFLPSLKTSLLTQLEQKGDRPKLFLFDIQDFQLPEVKEILQTKQLELQQESPLVRARLMKVNDKDIVVELDSQESTREQQQASRFATEHSTCRTGKV
jgi:putative ABC transport system permease protein